MEAVSTKCVAWLRRYSQEDIQVDTQEKIHKLAGFQAKIEQFEEKYRVFEMESAKTTNQLRELQCRNEEIEKDTAFWRDKSHQTSCRYAEMMERLQVIVSQVNGYLKIVNSEVKKKFGFFPEALLHAD